MEVGTSKCSGYRQAELVIRCDDSIPKQDVEWLIDWFENSVGDGERYSDGELVQIGWMLNLLSAMDDGRLLLREPDMQAIPIEWTDGVTETLRHLRLQKDTAESLGLGSDLQFPTIRHSAILGVDVDWNTHAFILERVAATAMDSGWFVGRLGSSLDYNDPENLHRVSLYEAVVRCPNIVMFMSLPFGIKVEYSDENIAVWLDGRLVTPSANSYLGRLAVTKGRKGCSSPSTLDNRGEGERNPTK